MKYTKPATTCEQQADLILARGMQADRSLLIERLRSTGYYRLSDAEAKEKYPEGWRAPKPYLRYVQPPRP